MIWFAALFPTVVLFVLLVWRELAHQREATLWAQERQLMLDRLMAGSLTEFELAQAMQQPAAEEHRFLDDAAEAELEKQLKSKQAE